MIFYAVSGLIAVLCTFLSQLRFRLSETCFLKGRVLIFFAFLVLFFLVGFQKGVGTDYVSYLDVYSRIMNYYPTHVEVGFRWLVYITIQLFDHPEAVFAVTAALTFGIFFLVIAKESDRPYLSLLVYLANAALFFQTFNLIRQSLALVFFLYSIKYLKRGSFVPYAATLIIGGLLHSSIMLLIPAFFLLRINFSRTALCLICALSFVFLVAIPKDLVLYAMRIVAPARYAPYFGSLILQPTEIGLGLGIMVNWLLAFYAIYKKNCLLADDPGNVGLVNAFVFSMVYLNCSLCSDKLFRFYPNIFIVSVLLIPKLVQVTRLRNRRFLEFAVSMALFLLFLRSAQSAGQQGPYDNIAFNFVHEIFSFSANKIH